MENAMGWVGFIMIVIFTIINLSILHKFVFRIYFSGTAIFREIFYAFLLAFFEAALVFKLFSGVFGVLIAIIKFLLRVLMILAIIAAIGFLLSKILPKILPKTKPVITKILLFINEKVHIFGIKPNKMEDENMGAAEEGPVPKEDQSDESTAVNKMILCSKCGEQLPEDAKFCQKCGTQVLFQEAVQTPVENRRENGAAVKRPTEPTSSNLENHQIQGNQGNVFQKKKSKKLPIILGVTALSIAVVIFVALNWEGKIDYVATVKEHTPFAVSQGLPYTYEEVLNQYLVSTKWEVRDEGDIHYVDISGISNGAEGELDLTIKVAPNPDDSDRVAIRPESATLDGTDHLSEGEAVDFLFYLFCLYDEGYEDLSALLELENETDYISQGEVSQTETFMDSGTEPDIYFNDIPVSELLNFTEFQVIQMFGGDYFAGDDGGIVYDEIEFDMIDDNTVGCITSFYPENFSINGYSLDDGSGEGVYSDRIIDLLGADYEEENSDWYYITYHYPAYTASFSISKYNEVGCIKIYSNLYEENGLIDDVLLESQEPIEYYQRLGGSYSAGIGQSTMTLSIYSSQEEGEVEIGSAVIYADDGQYFVGSLIPIDIGSYMVTTDTGEEVLLIEQPLSDEVVLELYVDGQCIEQYQMTEHYVP